MLKYLPLKGGRKESGTDRKRRQVVYVIVIAKQNYAEQKKKKKPKCQKSKQKKQSIYLFRERSREELFQITFKISILTRRYCRIIQGLKKNKKRNVKRKQNYILFYCFCYFDELVTQM